MIGGNRVAEPRQEAGVLDVSPRGGTGAHSLEERRVGDVRGLRIPGVTPGALGYRQRLPHLVAVEHPGVLALEHRGLE